MILLEEVSFGAGAMFICLLTFLKVAYMVNLKLTLRD